MAEREKRYAVTGSARDKRYAKRIMARAAIDEAYRLGTDSRADAAADYHGYIWRRIRALAYQAAEQLRQSEG